MRVYYYNAKYKVHSHPLFVYLYVSVDLLLPLSESAFVSADLLKLVSAAMVAIVALLSCYL